MEQLDYNEYNELFAFGPSSGELINRADRGKRAKKGESALSKNRQGRLQVRIGNKAIAAERVCLLLLNGEDPGNSITFIDGNYTNLRADNLRVSDSTKDEGKAHREAENEPEPIVEDPPALNGEVVQLKTGKWIARRLEGGGIRIVGRYDNKAAAIEALK